MAAETMDKKQKPDHNKPVTYARLHENSSRGIVMSHAYGNTHPNAEQLQKFENGPLKAASERIAAINKEDNL